jgi:molybdopterin-guanine dinucleotide biosynthesis protein A
VIPFTIAICAGGKSSRMGMDKAFVDLGGKPMIQHVLDCLNALGQQETILITNRADAYAAFHPRAYADVLPERGSLGGIYSAIHYSNTPYTLVVGCDMPFLNAALLRYMTRLIEKAAFDVIVPYIGDRYEGLHAIYSKTCLEPIRGRLDQGELKATGFYDDIRVRAITEPECRQYDPKGYSFFNVNTPEQLSEARRLLADC